MATDLGKVGMRARGTWNNTTTYEVLDAVSYNGGLYIAMQAVPANTLPTNTTYWQVALSPSIIEGKFAQKVDYDLSDTSTMYTFNTDGYLCVTGTGEVYVYGSASGQTIYFVMPGGTSAPNTLYVKKGMRTKIRTTGLTEYRFLPFTY